jgi:hypothetical protein
LNSSLLSLSDNQTIERRTYSTCRLKIISLWYRKLRTLWEMKKRHNVSHQCWFSKTLEHHERLFQKLLNDYTPLITVVKSTCSDLEVPKPQKLAKNLTRRNDLEPIVHSQDIRTFFFDPSTHYVFMYIKKMCRQKMIISSLIILFYKLCTLEKNLISIVCTFYLKIILIVCTF